ncbi:MAG: secondary thiamine-phosphate synthase enzyme YjbQ [Bacteroidia bacterium]|nr:secondary thiamine-phosphate synthase enzyme YjbQ [Bacteroidia bacterium]
MTIINDSLNIDTHGGCDMVDITDQLTRMLQRYKLKNGQVLVFVPGSTAGVTTIEYEPGLKKDFSVFMERIIPKNAQYYHEETWNDGNGHSHIRASLLGPSLVIPIGQGRLLLGTWQQVVVVDFDNRPRSRDLVVQFSGE